MKVILIIFIYVYLCVCHGECVEVREKPTGFGCPSTMSLLETELSCQQALACGAILEAGSVTS